MSEYKLKVGDGVTPWNQLPYISGTDSGGSTRAVINLTLTNSEFEYDESQELNIYTFEFESNITCDTVYYVNFSGLSTTHEYKLTNTYNSDFINSNHKVEIYFQTPYYNPLICDFYVGGSDSDWYVTQDEYSAVTTETYAGLQFIPYTDYKITIVGKNIHVENLTGITFRQTNINITSGNSNHLALAADYLNEGYLIGGDNYPLLATTYNVQNDKAVAVRLNLYGSSYRRFYVIPPKQNITIKTGSSSGYSERVLSKSWSGLGVILETNTDISVWKLIAKQFDFDSESYESTDWSNIIETLTEQFATPTVVYIHNYGSSNVNIICSTANTSSSEYDVSSNREALVIQPNRTIPVLCYTSGTIFVSEPLQYGLQ